MLLVKTVNDRVDATVLGIIHEQYHRFNYVAECHDGHIKYG